MGIENEILFAKDDGFYYDGLPSSKNSQNEKQNQNQNQNEKIPQISFKETENVEATQANSKNEYIYTLPEATKNRIIFSWLSIIFVIILILKGLVNYLKNAKTKDKNDLKNGDKPVGRYMIIAAILMLVNILIHIVF